jgi:hypothetical protein
MKIRVNFGLSGSIKDVSWYQPVEDFPKFVEFAKKKWEWFFYDKDQSGQFDYVLTFSEIPSYDPNYNTAIPTWEDLFWHQKSYQCECGAAYSSFPWDHMKLCKLWKPWEEL